MDWNLKKLADIFQVLPVYFFFFFWGGGGGVKTNMFCSLRQIPLLFSSRCSKSNFMLFFKNILCNFDQDTVQFT